MSMVKKTDGDWMQVLKWRTAKPTGVSTLVAEGHKQKKMFEFKFPDGETRMLDPIDYNQLAGIHFTKDGWREMTQEEFMA